MKTWCWLVVTLGVAAFLSASAQEGDRKDAQVLKGFSVPDYDSEMNLKSKLRGDEAVSWPNGKVDIKNLMIEFFDKDEEVSMRVSAPECRYDRKRKKAYSEGDVRIARDDMVVTGKGFSWNASDERFLISTNVKVVLKNVSMKAKSGE